jgi:beta-phosphoglucomutase
MPAMLAVIFDMDGVLVDSYRPHYEGWRRLAGEHGLELTEPQFARTFGQTSRDIIRRFWGERVGENDAEVASLDERKESLYREIVSVDFPAMDGAAELLDALHAAGIRLAVGSSGPPQNVDLAIDKLGRRAIIDAAVTGRDVTRGKPDPEVFLLAAERLSVEPASCVVVEDAPAGIVAAKRAGMTGVALLSSGRTAGDFTGVAADLVVGSLRDLGPEPLRAAHRAATR